MFGCGQVHVHAKRALFFEGEFNLLLFNFGSEFLHFSSYFPDLLVVASIVGLDKLFPDGLVILFILDDTVDMFKGLLFQPLAISFHELSEELYVLVLNWLIELIVLMVTRELKTCLTNIKAPITETVFWSDTFVSRANNRIKATAFALEANVLYQLIRTFVLTKDFTSLYLVVSVSSLAFTVTWTA